MRLAPHGDEYIINATAVKSPSGMAIAERTSPTCGRWRHEQQAASCPASGAERRGHRTRPWASSRRRPRSRALGATASGSAAPLTCGRTDSTGGMGSATKRRWRHPQPGPATVTVAMPAVSRASSRKDVGQRRLGRSVVRGDDADRPQRRGARHTEDLSPCRHRRPPERRAPGPRLQGPCSRLPRKHHTGYTRQGACKPGNAPTRASARLRRPLCPLLADAARARPHPSFRKRPLHQSASWLRSLPAPQEARRAEQHPRCRAPPSRGLVPPVLLSLFSGCGGLDLGFERAGFRVGLAYDVRSDSIDSWNRNRRGPTRGHVADLTAIRFADIDRHFDARFTPSALIGGPPCQSFSRANRSPVPHDPRTKLVRRFFTPRPPVPPPPQPARLHVDGERGRVADRPAQRHSGP